MTIFYFIHEYKFIKEKFSYMKRSFRNLSILLFIVYLYPVRAGQNNIMPGYIITLRNDTIYGFIQNNGYIRNSRICFFTENIDSTEQEFLPGEIYSYRFTGGKYYISETIDIDSIPHNSFS
jgi:hypothetical protein